MVEEQRTKRSNDDDRIFPFNHRSVGTAFRRGCADLGIHSSWAWSRTRENAVIALKPESLVELAAHEFDSGDAELQPPPFGTIDATALHIAQLIKAELAQRESANELYIDSLITLFGVHLLRKYTSQKKPTAKLTSGLSSSSTRRLQEFLSENFARKLSVGELAAVAGFSPGHFIQAFTKTFGTPPHSHVVKLRLDFAEKLLVKGSLTVAEVAYLSGFSSQSHLTASMTKHRSTTPTQMRARRER
ncbi:helix-turn-helix transcriptional regulator [Mesorhizobium caraganae]|nr:helix-turn-helix transcriptional regulator [Mesorhizobium caraganae]